MKMWGLSQETLYPGHQVNSFIAVWCAVGLVLVLCQWCSTCCVLVVLPLLCVTVTVLTVCCWFIFHCVLVVQALFCVGVDAVVFVVCWWCCPHCMLVVQFFLCLVVQTSLCVVLIVCWRYLRCSVLVSRSLLCVDSAVLVVRWWCGPDSIMLWMDQ